MPPMQPHTTPDMADLVDSPDDQIRQLALDCGLFGPLPDVVLGIVKQAGLNGLLERFASSDWNQRSAHELTRRIIAIIGDGQNAGLRAECLDFLAGTNVFGGRSETEIGRRFGFSRANVSYICKQLQKQLGTLAAPGGKRDEVCAKYSERAKRCHAEGRIKRRIREPYRAAAHFAAITQPTP